MTEREAVTKYALPAYLVYVMKLFGGREGGMVANCLFKMDQITILT